MRENIKRNSYMRACGVSKDLRALFLVVFIFVIFDVVVFFLLNLLLSDRQKLFLCDVYAN